MRPKVQTPREFIQRYPRITAHIISESLGYATPTKAAQIGLDGLYGRENWSEWVYSCYDRDARRVLQKAISSRHNHEGFMSWYKDGALKLVMHAIKTEDEPVFGSWF